MCWNIEEIYQRNPGRGVLYTLQIEMLEIQSWKLISIPPNKTNVEISKVAARKRSAVKRPQARHCFLCFSIFLVLEGGKVKAGA